MVSNRKKHTPKTHAKQEADPIISKPMKIGAATPYDFRGSNLTPYGGLLPVATMLEKLQFRELIEQHVTINRLTTSMPGFSTPRRLASRSGGVPSCWALRRFR